MEINFDKKLKNIDGSDMLKQVKLPDGSIQGSTDAMTLKETASVALNSVLGEKQISEEEKYKRYLILKAINDATGPIDLKIEEIATIKKQIGLLFSPLVVGQCWDMLEGK